MRARAVLLGVLAAALAAPALAAGDSYEELKAMEGHWVSTTRSGRHEQVDNSCARTGLFFVCEQAIGGKPASLIVFLPKAHEHEDKGPEIQVQVLDSAGDRAGPWRRLKIEGDHWYIEPLETPREHAPRERTVESFSGPDFIHVETQVSTDGEHWTVLSSESLQRAP